MPNSESSLVVLSRFLRKTRGRGAVCAPAMALLVAAGVAASSGPVSAMAKRRPHVVTFPSTFLWGAATAAHQVEGGNTNNDWYEWEREGHTANLSGDADDEYHRYPQDLELAQELGHNAFRLSIEWSRIEPEMGKFDEAEVQHYRQELQTAHDRGLKTFVTLHHFTNPIWAAHQGGWLNEEMPGWFAGFVAYVVPQLGDLVDYWLTINEPNVYALTGYLVGATPPGVQDQTKLAPVLANLLKAHANAYHLIHAFYPDAKVGFAHHMRVFSPANPWNPLDRIVASFIDDFWNNQILKAMKTGRIHLHVPFLMNYDEQWPWLKNTLDFIGINYYTRDLIKFDLSLPQKFAIVPNTKAQQSEMGWEIYPHGMYEVVMRAASFGLPIYITENGISDPSDAQRKQFICDHLRELGHAMEDGADVRGYLYWALIDNFEWTSGFGPRFGLIQVDYTTQARNVRPSAYTFKQIIESESLAVCDGL